MKTRAERRKWLKAFLAVDAEVKAGEHKQYEGICKKVLRHMNKGLQYPQVYYCSALEELFSRWPESVGPGKSPQFPVGGLDEYANPNPKLWDNPRRHELLAWCIAELRRTTR